MSVWPVKTWDTRNHLALSVSGIVLLLCVLPILILLFSLDFSSAQKTDLVFLDSITLFLKSIVLNTLVVLLTLIAGTTLAFLIVRIKASFQLGLLALFSLPLFLPSYVHALTWANLFSAINSTSNRLINIQAEWATIWVLFISYYPIVLLVVTAGLVRWDQRFSETALLHGQPWRSFVFIQLPYLLPYSLISALLVFLLTFADFAVPDYFQVHVYATEVFIQLSAYLNPQAALYTSLLPLSLSLLLLYFLAKLINRLTFASSDGRQRSVFTQSISRHSFLAVPFWILVVIAAILIFLPLLNLIYLAGDLNSINRAFVSTWQDAFTSAGIASLATLMILLLAITYAYVQSRRIQPAGSWLRFIILMMLVMPGSLLALAYIQFWNQPGWFGWFYASGCVLVLALAARWLPLAAEFFLNAFSHLSQSQEQAAYSVGASWWRTFKTILLPQLLPVVRIAALLVFVFIFNELTMSVLLTPPGVSTLPVRLFSTIHYGPDSLIASICLWQLIYLLIPLALLTWFSRDYFTAKLRLQN